MLFLRSYGLIGEGKITELIRDGKKNLLETGMGLSMKTDRGRQAFSFLLLMLLLSAQGLWASENLATGGRPPSPDSIEENGKPSQYGLHLLTNLVGDTPISQATLQRFSVLLDRHRSELERLANTHQDLIWEALGVAIELLPSLRTVDTYSGQLRLNRKTFARVTSLMEKCERLASPELAQDLRNAKKIVDSRLQEDDQEGLILDLKE